MYAVCAACVEPPAPPPSADITTSTSLPPAKIVTSVASLVTNSDSSISFATTVQELKDERGQYQIITPAEASDYIARGIPLALQPLVGGIPPDVAWRYLETAAQVSAKETSS